MKPYVSQLSGEQAYNYISQFANPEASDSLVVHTTNIFNIVNHDKKASAIVNLGKVNDIRYINKFFEQVNDKLDMGGMFIGRFETFTARRRRKKINRIPFIGHLYFAFEFIFMRVFPKLPVLKKLYFFVTRGHNRLLSKAETLGRLVSCGFEIVSYEAFSGLTYFVTRKVAEPKYDMNPSYGLLYRMPRISKGGKMIKVYKFRTMHPYAEYLQDYVLKVNGYSSTGKPADDFRLTPWGKWMRKYWIDELPQIINLLKGDLKLVGVRPISKRYFEDIPNEIRELRFHHKPGCIPPYVALNRDCDVVAVLNAEREYMVEKIRDPYTTDVRYFFMAMYNIVLKNKRSA
jgi:lipopolysaccharide/colanic/teichoic acid biosynthesis glycosyltransferase